MNMRSFNFLRYSVLLVFLPYVIYAQRVENQDPGDLSGCFTVMAGKAATVDGSVLFAHNEDDYGKQLVNWIAEPGRDYHEGSEVVLKNGGRLNQVHRTNRFFWLEIPGMDFSDSYLNECGVCISSNSCPSKEDKPDLTDGGIGYRLRGLMAERAQTARDAVVLAGMLIERFGYTGSGRTYCIADQNEAWVLAAVRGKHWVARRIPDDEVMILPNSYTIDQVDLTDQSSFLACKDLIDYAVSRGWYDPGSGRPFSFREAYASVGSLRSPGNINRAWVAYHLFSTDYGLNDIFPFSFKPASKVSKEFLMELLRNHYEGTELDKSRGYTKGSPYELNGSMICNKASVCGFVAELRDSMPADIGCVMWLAPQWPDIQPFIPWYAGTVVVPESYCRPGYPETIDDHYQPPQDIHEYNDQHAFWAFVWLSELMNNNYAERIPKVTKNIKSFESALLRMQPRIESKVLKIYGRNPEEARMIITAYTNRLAERSLKMTKKAINKYGHDKR